MSNQIRYISTNEKFHAEKPRPNTLFEFLFWKPPTVFPMACRGPKLQRPSRLGCRRRHWVRRRRVLAGSLFSPRDRAIALQPTPTWVFGDSNPPQKPAAGCSPCCTCAHLETQPLHRWRRWRWGYPSSDTLLPFGPPATAEWSSVDLPTWRGRLCLSGLVSPRVTLEQYRGSGAAEVQSLPCTDL